mgnify:CR=1 FL=1|jgi:hypothetical protein
MRLFLLVLIVFIFHNCTKPKTVLICGNHVCINKKEAQQYFEENLSLEVKIINKKDEDKFDLVQLNLKNDNKEVKQISVQQKNNTNEKLKILTNDEIKKIKKEISLKEKNQSYTKKIDKKKRKNIDKDISKKNININKDKSILKKKVIMTHKNNIVDVCTIIEKCSIDEISKYLLGQGKSRKFPDITTRE